MKEQEFQQKRLMDGGEQSGKNGTPATKQKSRNKAGHPLPLS